MRRIYEIWWASIVVYTLTISLFSLVLSIDTNLAFYVLFLVFTAAIIVLISILVNLLKKNWLKAFLGSVTAFSMTILSITLMIFTGLIKDEPIEERELVLESQYHERRFEEYTKLSFPKSAVFLAKDDTVHAHGYDYTASCIFEVSDSDFDKIHKSISSNPQFDETQISISDEDHKLTESFKFSKLTSGLYIISFDSDEKIISITFYS